MYHLYVKLKKVKTRDIEGQSRLNIKNTKQVFSQEKKQCFEKKCELKHNSSKCLIKTQALGSEVLIWTLLFLTPSGL